MALRLTEAQYAALCGQQGQPSAQHAPRPPQTLADAWATILACFQTPGRRIEVYDYATCQWQAATVVGAGPPGRRNCLTLIYDGGQRVICQSVHDCRFL